MAKNSFENCHQYSAFLQIWLFFEKPTSVHFIFVEQGVLWCLNFNWKKFITNEFPFLEINKVSLMHHSNRGLEMVMYIKLFSFIKWRSWNKEYIKLPTINQEFYCRWLWEFQGSVWIVGTQWPGISLEVYIPVTSFTYNRLRRGIKQPLACKLGYPNMLTLI